MLGALHLDHYLSLRSIEVHDVLADKLLCVQLMFTIDPSAWGGVGPTLSAFGYIHSPWVKSPLTALFERKEQSQLSR